MGLYLCVFDKLGTEVDGVEVGSYSDFNFFRDAVAAAVEHGVPGSVCQTLQGHSDSDGSWSVNESGLLLKELELIERLLSNFPPVEFNSSWKADVARVQGIKLSTLLDCFFDVDGEPLVGRLRCLAEASVENNEPILFQ